MHKLFLGVGILIALLSFSANVSAASNNVMIYQVQSGATGVAGDASSEFVSLYNNSTQRVDVTNWQVVSNSNIIATFTASNSSNRLYIEPQSFVTMASSTFKTPSGQSYTPSVLPAFTGNKIVGSSSSGVSFRLLDSAGGEVDAVQWTTDGASNTQVLQRKTSSVSPMSLTDTDSFSDFDKITQTAFVLPTASLLTEEVVQVDVCPNIPGLDVSPPIGYMQDTDGNCYEDMCDNMPALQKAVPAGLYRYGIDCFVVEIKITEILPNVSGSDTGREYIELYNPTSYDTNLSGYYLQTGPSFSKNYPLPDVALAAGSYAHVTDLQSGVTLPNSTASLKLFANGGQQIDETESYNNPADDYAWALFTDSWRYTNVPTPSSENIESSPGMGAGEADGLAPCAAGKYRNPETNRCRNIETDEGLKPCAIDQIRNPLTNRCRSIFSSDSGLTPCKPGQTRNPETNRCRNNASASTSLKPCEPNQERNPETNRCRKKVESQSTAVVEDVESAPVMNHGGMLLAGSATLGLAGYGVAEWRREISSGVRKILAALGKGPPEL